MAKTKIEWTETSWNPVTGCTKISPGCKYCYAERMAKRLQAMDSKNYNDGFKVAEHDDVLTKPLFWKKPHTIFVNSMSDLFHKEIDFSFIEQVFNIMRKANWHTFQILTKRSNRLVKLNDKIVWPQNVWMGVSVEDNDYLHRIDDLKRTDAVVKFISFEPLLGKIECVDLNGIDWVIAGGESGPHARPMKEDWVLSIKEQCHQQDVPFFFKQWGGVNKKKNGRELRGEIYEEMPIFDHK